MSSSSSQVKTDDGEKMYETLEKYVMQQSLRDAKKEQDQRGNTTVTDSERQLEQAVMKGDLKEVARITRSELMNEISANRNQISKLKKEMNYRTENATTLQEIKDIETKLQGFYDKFKSYNNYYTDKIKKLESSKIATLNRLETIRDKGIQVPQGQINNDNFTIRETDYIIMGYNTLISDNQELIEYIENFTDKDLTNKHESIFSNEFSLLELEETEEKQKGKKKGKKKPPRKRGGKKSKRKTKRKTNRKTKRKTKRN